MHRKAKDRCEPRNLSKNLEYFKNIKMARHLTLRQLKVKYEFKNVGGIIIYNISTLYITNNNAEYK